MGWLDEFISGFDSAYKKAKDKEDFNEKSSSELKRMLENKNLSYDERKKIEKRILEKESQEEYNRIKEYEKNRNKY